MLEFIVPLLNPLSNSKDNVQGLVTIVTIVTLYLSYFLTTALPKYTCWYFLIV